jgi:transposase-like protein
MRSAHQRDLSPRNGPCTTGNTRWVTRSALLRWLIGAAPGGPGPGDHLRASSSSAPAGFRFPREVIAVAVRWYLRYGLSYRDVEELLAERGIAVDDVTVYRWVQTFTAEFIDAARPARHACGDRWFVDETYVEVAGRWTYLYRAVDQYGQVIDVPVCKHRDGAAARAFFARALTRGASPVEVTTDRPPVYPRVIGESARPRARSSSDTRTTASTLTTAGSRPGCDREPFGRLLARPDRPILLTAYQTRSRSSRRRPRDLPAGSPERRGRRVRLRCCGRPAS